jgi:hypothetical protein
MERWLELDLLIEQHLSMIIWDPIIDDLARLFLGHGAFRLVRIWRMREGEIFNDQRKLSPLELCDPTGRRMIGILTDCVSDAWDSGRMTRLIEVWGRHGPVVVFNLLPTHMWPSTGLGCAVPMTLRVPRPGAPNRELAATPRISLPRKPPRGALVHVSPIEPRGLERFATALLGRGSAAGTGALLPSAIPGPIAASTHSEPADPKTLLHTFLVSATPTARKLASLLCAAPITLPIVRLVQQTMLPHSDQGHLAEFFLGGLLVQESDDHYDFAGGVRDLLLDAAPPGQIAAVLERVSSYVVDHLGSTIDFRAVLRDPDAPIAEGTIAAGDLPFARVGTAALERLGVRYRRVVAELADRAFGGRAPDPEAPPPDEASQIVAAKDVTDFELQRQELDRLGDELDELLAFYMRTGRKRAAVEAKEELTGAYVRLVFAYAYARLGLRGRSEELIRDARAALDLTDPIHSLASSAYAARTEQALAGWPEGAPLPVQLLDRLVALQKFDRYKVDRLREVSFILEPIEALEPVGAYQRPLGRETDALRKERELESLTREIDRILSPTASLEDGRILNVALSMLPRMPSAEAQVRLERILIRIDAQEKSSRGPMLQSAMRVSGYFGFAAIAAELAKKIKSLLQEADAGVAAQIVAGFYADVRVLHRLGIEQELAELATGVEELGEAVGERDALVASAGVAGARLCLGEIDRAVGIMIECQRTLTELAARRMHYEHLLNVHRALAFAFGLAPDDLREAGLHAEAAILRFVTDTYGTNSHFCRSVVSFMEALVLAYAPEHRWPSREYRAWRTARESGIETA